MPAASVIVRAQRQEASLGAGTGRLEMPKMARRRYQEGSIRKKGSNWTLRFRERVYGQDGAPRFIQRTRILLPATRKKDDAKREAARFMARLDTGNRHNRSAISFRSFWQQHIEATAMLRLKFSTRQLYGKLAAKHLLPAFGDDLLVDIDRLGIQQFLKHKETSGLSPQTVRHLRNLLSSTFRRAILLGYVGPENPAQYVELPRMIRTPRARVLQPEEVSALAANLPEPARTIFLVCVLAGLRIGETLALGIADVDLAGRTIYVRRSVYLGVLDTPKTRRSERSIPMAKTLATAIRQWLTRRPTGSALLFPSEVGTTLRDRNVLTRQVWPVCDRLEIPRFGWHSLRHTFATLGGDQGVPLPVIQSLLGHSTLDTTAIYLHAMDDTKRAAVEQVARLMWPNVAQMQPVATGSKGRIQ